MAGTGKAHLRAVDDDTVLRVEDLVVDFPIGRTGLVVSAVAGISLDVRRGETLGIVGESGCGKTTTGRAIMQLPGPTSGSVRLEGTELTTLATKPMRAARTRMQMIFQDPISSLNPRRTRAQHRARAARHPPARHLRRAGRDRRSHPGRGRDRPRACRREPSAPALRRPVPAHLDRPLARARPDARDLRRAGVGARRQRAGAGAQPARGPQGRVAN